MQGVTHPLATSSHPLAHRNTPCSRLNLAKVFIDGQARPTGEAKDRAGAAKEEEATPELDELEQYLADPEEPDIDVKVLAWWQAKESKWPMLAKMVKQYLAAPASSAGVERVFSAAGKMHGDLQKSSKDSTLEHSLFAAFNTD